MIHARQKPVRGSQINGFHIETASKIDSPVIPTLILRIIMINGAMMEEIYSIKRNEIITTGMEFKDTLDQIFTKWHIKNVLRARSSSGVG